MHCKAGKGRAGLMCCVLLLRAGVVQSADDAFKKYDATRVTDGRGLTVTSQQKYVKFFEEIWRQYFNIPGNIGAVKPSISRLKKLPIEPEFFLQKITLVWNYPENDPFGEACAAIAPKLNVKVWSVPDYIPELIGSTKSEDESLNCVLKGNFKVKVTARTGLGKTLKVTELKHNTLFIIKDKKYVDFGMSQLDVKKKTKKILGDKFLLRLEFGQRMTSDSVEIVNSAGGSQV
jgi:hypothetical protein